MTKIGLYDSGIGGFSLLRPLYLYYPNIQVYYFADKEFAPYGSKPAFEIQERSRAIYSEMNTQQVNALLIACNTATAICIDDLRSQSKIPIFGIEPYLNIIHQGVLPTNAKVACLMTSSMLESNRYQALKKRLDPQTSIDSFGSVNLARLVEAIWNNPQDLNLIKQISDELAFLKNRNYTHLILGCTHYPLIQRLIEKELELICIDPAQKVIDYMATKLGPCNLQATKGVPSLTFQYKESISNQWTARDYAWPFERMYSLEQL